ncbi:MAG: TlpA family protein disulfide reductase [Pedobacter sp.]|nr:MAG: TlpA family protein disulfide reductase [Pedobacter sp.]
MNRHGSPNKDFNAIIAIAVLILFIRKADTVYQNISCYSFFIKIADTVNNGQHDFIHKYVLINKKNFLPVNFKEKGEGTASKGDYVIGRVVVNNENIYSNINVNPEIASNPISFNGFHLKNTKMLSVGDSSPKLEVRTIFGDVVDESVFKNKVLLVVFGSIDCPANPLANPVLNRLYAKYKDKNLAIFDIFTSETGEQVKKYIEANSLNFPSYLATRKQHADFKIISTPNFYVIGTDRKIKAAIEGYSDKLENQLIKTIDELLASY